MMSQLETHSDGPDQSEVLECNEAQQNMSGGMPDRTSGTRVIDRELQHLQSVPQNLSEAPDEIPTPYAQLNAIVQLGKKMYREAPGGKSIEMWEAYKECINSFRAAGGLPPIHELSSRSTFPITDAMARGDTKTLMRLFAEEKETYDRRKQFWEKVKRAPVINFFVGAGAGAAELGHGIFTIANESRKALGMGTSEEEQAKAKEVMVAVGESLKHFDKLVAAFLRKDEYVKSINEEGGETVGYVLGKHYFDLALMLVGGGVLKEGAKHGGKATAEAAGRAAAATREVFQTAGEKAANTLGEAARSEVVREAAVTTGAAAVGVRLAEGFEKGAEVATRLGKHAAKEGIKEGPKEIAKEVAKHSPHAAEEAAGGGHS